MKKANAILLVISGIVAALTLELGATVILKTRFQRQRSDMPLAVQKVLDELPQATATKDAKAPEGQDRRLNLGREPHPFFGFTTNRSHPGVNNLGFYSRHKYPYQREPGDFVVGIFGGSVAQQLASEVDAAKVLEKALMPLADSRGKSRVVILSMALPGWRQPQQFHAFHYFLRSIDVAITLDGLNEVVGIQTNLDRNYPVDYPNPEVWLPLSRSVMTPADVRTASEIMTRQDSVRAWTGRLASGLPGKSAFLHVCWQIFVGKNMLAIDQLRQDMASSQWQSYDTTPTDDEGYDAVKESYFELYAASVRSAQREAADQGKIAYHFIQPNQYDDGSKPLSDEERRLYTSNKYYRLSVSRYYPRLREMVKDLRATGVETYDLTQAFARSGETLYNDDCCHLNEQGNVILARAIAARFEVRSIAAPSH